MSVRLMRWVGNADTVGVPTNFTNAYARETTWDGDSGVANFYLNANGAIALVGDDTNSPVSNWLAPQVGMNRFEVEVVVTSGTTPAGDATGVGVWTALGGVDRIYSISRGSPGTTTCTLTFTIRQIGLTTPTYVSSGVNIRVTVNPGPEV